MAGFYFIDVVFFDFNATDAVTIIDGEYTYIYIAKYLPVPDQLLAGWRELIKFLLNAPAIDYDEQDASYLPCDLDHLYHQMAMVAVNPCAMKEAALKG